VALTRCWWRQRWQNAAADCGVTVVLLFSLMFFCSFYISSFSRFLSSPLNLCLSLLLFFLLPLPSLILKTLSPQSFPLLCSSLLSIFLLSFSFFLLLSSSSVFFLFGFGFFFLFFHSPISLPVLPRVKICPSVPSVFLLKMSLVFQFSHLCSSLQTSLVFQFSPLCSSLQTSLVSFWFFLFFFLVRSLLYLCFRSLFFFFLSKSPPLCFSFFSSLLSLYPPLLFFSLPPPSGSPVERGIYRTGEVGATLPLSNPRDKVGWLRRPLCSCQPPAGLPNLIFIMATDEGRGLCQDLCKWGRRGR